jgi:hypothetical protein
VCVDNILFEQAEFLQAKVEVLEQYYHVYMHAVDLDQRKTIAQVPKITTNFSQFIHFGCS